MLLYLNERTGPCTEGLRIHILQMKKKTKGRENGQRCFTEQESLGQPCGSREARVTDRRVGRYEGLKGKGQTMRSMCTKSVCNIDLLGPHPFLTQDQYHILMLLCVQKSGKLACQGDRFCLHLLSGMQIICMQGFCA